MPSFFVKEPAGVARDKWPVSSGIGLYKNQAHNVNELGLKNASNQVVPAQFDILSCWGEKVNTNAKSCENGGSIRVVRVSFQTQLNAFEEKAFTLDQSSQGSSGTLLAIDSGANITINTGVAEFVINKQKFNLFDHVTRNNGQTEMVGQTGGIYIVDENGSVFETTDMIPEEVVIEDNGPLRAAIYIKGYLRQQGGGEIYGEKTVFSDFYESKDFLVEAGHTDILCDPLVLDFPKCFPKYNPNSPSLWKLVPIEVRMEFYKDQDFVKLTTSLTNEGGTHGHPNSAGSAQENISDGQIDNFVLHLNEFGLRLPLNMPDQTLNFQTHYQSGEIAKTDKLEKIQIHKVNSHREQDNLFYQVLKNDTNIVERGRRTSGLLNIESDQAGVLVDMLDFWQKYPSSIAYDNNHLIVKFLPECPASITNSLCRYPVNGAGAADQNPDNPNESDVRIHSSNTNIPNYRYDINVYNVSAGKRILNTIYLSFHAPGISTQQASLMADSVKTSPLLAVAPANYSANTFAFGEIPVGQIHSNPSTFSYSPSSIEPDATEMDQVFSRFNRLQASYTDPSIGEHKQNRVSGGRDHRFRSNIGAYPGVSAGAGREEGRYAGHNQGSETNFFGSAAFGNFDYGDILWVARSGRDHSNLHYDHDASLCRIFMSTGDYNHFEWCRSGARFKSDIGFNHVTVPDKSNANSFSMFTNVYETTTGHAFGRQPAGFLGHRWNEGMKFLYLMTGDRFAKQSLLRDSSALLAHIGTFEFTSAGARWQTRSIKNLINGYQAFGDSILFAKAQMLMEKAKAKQLPNGRIENDLNTLMDVYFVKGFTSFLLESLAQDHAIGTTLSTDLLGNFARFYKDTFLIIGSGTTDNYKPSGTFLQNETLQSASANAEAIDIMYVGYLLTQNTEYLRKARQWFRDVLLFNCSITETHVLSSESYNTAEGICRLGAYADGRPGSVSKNTGFLMAMGSFATLMESTLGGQAINSHPQIGNITGLPLIDNQGIVEIQVSDPDNDIKEVRLEWLSKEGGNADERFQHLLCFDDGGAQSREVMVGPTYNERTQGNSGDITASDGIYTCTIQESDGISSSGLSSIRVVAIDKNAQREFKRINNSSNTNLPLINDDFSQNIGNWDGRWNAVNGVYQAPHAIGVSYNSTPLPKALTIETDFSRAEDTSIGHDVKLYFHSHQIGFDPRGIVGYYIRYSDWWGDEEDGLYLYRQSSIWGGWTQLAFAPSVVVDGNPHHLKITDDGNGHIQVYFDGGSPVIDVQDSNYVGVANSFVAVHSYGNAKAAFDNFKVTE